MIQIKNYEKYIILNNMKLAFKTELERHVYLRHKITECMRVKKIGNLTELQIMSKINVIGVAHCQWIEDNDKDKGEYEEYSAEENLCKLKAILCGDGSRKFTHSNGRISYPFSLILPGYLPMSFESKYGYIRYELEGKRIFLFLHLIFTYCTAQKVIVNVIKFAGAVELFTFTKKVRDIKLHFFLRVRILLTLVFTFSQGPDELFV